MGTINTIATDVLEGHGNFSIDNDPYFDIPAGWTVTGGAAVFNNVAAANISKTGVAVVGRLYRVKFEVKAISAGATRVFLGTAAGTFRISTGIYEEDIICAGSTTVFLQATGNSNLTVDDLTVKEIVVVDNSKGCSLDLSGGLGL